MLRRFYQFAIIAGLAIGLTACGGNKPATEETNDTETMAEDNTMEEAAETKEEEKPTEELVPAETLTLTAVGEDMSAISYSPTELSASAFTPVQLDFTNTASTEGMNHNAVIIPFDDAVADEIRAAGMKAGGPGFSPVDDRIIAKTDMLNPGESTSIKFETPGPGKYYIICTFPGHKAMVATLTVN
ncbi:hypothetical protein GC194_08300 [bacterium]|nr:hypothetical protein [bacterium]